MSQINGKCNISFVTKYAKVDNNIIDIHTYIKGGYSSNSIVRCVPHDHELIPVKCKQRESYFRHKHASDTGGEPMTQWHIEWQSNFPITEQSFRNKAGQHKDRRGDVVIPDLKRVIEIQHSPIQSGEVNERNQDYRLHDHSVVWIIDSQESINVKSLDKRIILEFKDNTWLYSSFLSCDNVFYDINGLIYMVSPKNIRSNQVDVSEPMLKSDFIEAVSTMEYFFSKDEPPQAYLYLKQQGAGSGKTYGMMQLLDKDPQISQFKWIIFLTKQHSAVNVMYKEFIKQYTEGHFKSIKFREEPILNSEGKYDESQYQTHPKKYIIIYTHLVTGVETCAIFATVDSFTYSVGESSKSSYDQFVGIVKSITEGVTKISKSGSMKYAGLSPYINKESIIMIDETQDLTDLYGQAFLKVVKTTHTNLCVVGDKLQSLTVSNNALTTLERAEFKSLKVIKSDISNVVRRFSDPNLINFVNSIVPFETYDLPKMVAHKVVEAKEAALTVFHGKKVYANDDKENESVVKELEKIIELYSKEVDMYNRVPEDFLIVTPFTSKNPLVESLQLAINEFWKEKMENNQYVTSVKVNDPYWKNIDPSSYTRYAVFHKSQEMGSINLNDSEKATRIVSIHSSKGDGRKVVFVIGVSQSALQMFSQVCNNLIYNSLLHVAVTRQKEHLYFRIEEYGDDIWHRINNANCNIDTNITTFDYLDGKRATKLSRISDKIYTTLYDSINEVIVSKITLPSLQKTSDSKLLIDMGDHNIRYSSMLCNVIVYIANYQLQTKSTLKNQFNAILKTLKVECIKPVYSWKEYTKLLIRNSENHKKKEKSSEVLYIPILKLDKRKDDIDYKKYYEILYDTMIRVIDELKGLYSKEINYFCPLESVILWYMTESVTSGKYQKITINDVYNIIDTYNKSFDSTAAGHEHCKCKQHFNSQAVSGPQKHIEYLRNHYDRVAHITDLLASFTKKHPAVSWLYDRPVYYKEPSESNGFDISKRYMLIGYDSDNVYILNLKPQFNELNYNESIVSSIMDTWLISNVSKHNTKNFDYFSGKRVLTCYLSLDKEEIYTFEWSKSIQENKDFFIEKIYTIMLNLFKNKHEQYYNTFVNICREHDGYKAVLDYCETSTKEKITSPKYMDDFWSYIRNAMEDPTLRKKKSGKKEKWEEFREKDYFLEQLDGILERSLKQYLDIVDEESDSSDEA